MGKTVHDDILDAALQYIIDNADYMTVCETEPTTYEQAHSAKGTGTGKALADVVPAFTGPANGDASGRKVTSDEKAAVDIDQSGDADHVALCDVGSTKLLYVTTCTQQALTQGNTVTFPAWDIEIADPT